MAHRGPDLRHTLGAAARLWASPDHHDVQPEWWVACSGEMNVNYNLACCQSADNHVLVERCLQPLLDVGKPGIIMLAGPGLATSQQLAEAGWVGVGALPLMTLRELSGRDGEGTGTRALTEADLPEAREMLSDTYGLDRASAAAAVPDRAIEDEGMGAWGLFDEGRLVSSFTSVVQDGLVVVWSMATRVGCQGHGYGRRLLETVLSRERELGAVGSLLQSSSAGERLYRSLGFTVVEHWQLWSRPRWVMGRA
jgi:GNAT superfamily N-acetyltransferase